MNTLEKLKEYIYKLTEGEITPEIETNLSQIFTPFKQGSIGLAQINLMSGNVEYNAQKVVKYINQAQKIGLDLVIFPELTLTGFPLEDAIGRYPIIANENVKWIKEIAKITTKTSAMVGFLEPAENGYYYSSVAILKEGKIEIIVRKSVLTQYSEFNDYKYIKPYSAEKCSNNTLDNQDFNKTITINGTKYGITIGADISNCTNFQDFPIDKPTDEKPEIYINCATIPSYKNQQQLNMLSYISKKSQTPIVYINQVGAIDGTTFIGSSCVFDKNGKYLACAKSFDEQFLIVNPKMGLGKIYSLTAQNQENIQKEFSLDYEYDLERTYKTIILGIKDYFKKTGFKRAVLGLSGGLDSSVCAVLLADALGEDNVFGISMPSKLTSNESNTDAHQLADNLGINYTQAPIKDMFDTTTRCFDSLFKNIEEKWDGRYKKSFTPDNIQARSRAMFLWGISNEFSSCLPIATSDKSEAYMGYATINGDMSGGFAPIADVTKTKLFALARWLNKNRENKNVIPENIINKKPGAELAIDPKTGKTLIAEDALMPYEFLDEVIWRIENKKDHYNDMLNCKFLYEKKNCISKEQKIAWLDKFYKKMSTALYKRTIMPPYPIVDSIPYKQPITSCHINYKGISKKDLEQILRLT